MITNKTNTTMFKQILMGGIVMMLASCNSQTIIEPETPEIPEVPSIPSAKISLTRGQEKALEAQNELAFKLFVSEYATARKEGNNNILISPLSCATCLGMLANGATGEALNELTALLVPEGGTLEDLNSLNQMLASYLATVDPHSSLLLANSIWAHKNINVNKNFIDLNATYYNAAYQTLDLFSQSAADAINSWSAESTNGIIPQLFHSAPESPLVFANAMYFKGAWSNPFDKANTKEEIFHNIDGTSSNVDMMNAKFENCAWYFACTDFKAVSLTYGNTAYSLYAILPSESYGFDKFLSEYDTQMWRDIKDLMVPYPSVEVAMPKFDIKHEWDIKNALHNLGYNKILTEKGSLSGIFENAGGSDLLISQKSVLSINEAGAEGAAVSFGLWGSWNPGGVNPIYDDCIRLDHPFIYIIEEASTGAIVFIGAIDKF